MPPNTQPIDWAPLLKYFLLQCMLQYYCKSSVQTPMTGFLQFPFNILCKEVHSQLWACQAMVSNHHQYTCIFNIQVKITGVICRVVTPKNKERYPNPLTKQTGLHARLSYLKTRKDFQAPLERDMRNKKTNVIHRSKYKMKYYLLYFHLLFKQQYLCSEAMIFN